jgi:ABC-type multidrug transport system ATPase subunit
MQLTTPFSPPRVQAIDLHFAHPGTPERALFTALSAQLLPGVTLVSGGDGRGKTTLLRLLAGELQPTAGRVQYLGTAFENSARASSVFWADPRSDTLDAHAVSDYLSEQRRKFSGHAAGFSDSVLADMVQGLGLGEHLHKPFFMLSTGSRRKVLLAAALASGAALTLLDEPFAALDAPSIRCVLGALRQAAAHPARMCVIADYAAPDGVPLSGVIDLGD